MRNLVLTYLIDTTTYYFEEGEEDLVERMLDLDLGFWNLDTDGKLTIENATDMFNSCTDEELLEAYEYFLTN